MSILITSLFIPYLILVLWGLEQPYSYINFIYVHSKSTPFIVIMFTLLSITYAKIATTPRDPLDYISLKIAYNDFKESSFIDGIVVAISEEIFSRYLLFFLASIVLHNLGFTEIPIIITYVVVSGAVFSFFHYEPSAYTYYFLIGGILACLFIMTGVIGPIVVHYAYNTSLSQFLSKLFPQRNNQ